MKIPLNGVDGHWGGNFAFDENDTMYISSGNRYPGSIYRYDGNQFNKIYTSNKYINGFAFSGTDTLLFANRKQEIMKLTGFSSESRVFHEPSFRISANVTFGDNLKFSQQPDWDGDGQGDACDCDDNFMGENETGADCGGACGGTCNDCVPVLIGGDPLKNINIVFVPDEDDYKTNMPGFRNNIRQIIEEGFMASPEFKNNSCLFNFYYFPTPGDYEYDGNCFFELPDNLTDVCPIGKTAIVAKSAGPYCSKNAINTFSVKYDTIPGTGELTDRAKHTVLHEFGHNKFELADEYCCGGSYWQSGSGQPNVYNSLAACQADSKNSASCRNFCPEQICTNTHPNLVRWNAAGNTLGDCKAWATTQGLNPGECKQEPSGVCSPNWQVFRRAVRCNWNSQPACQQFAVNNNLNPADCRPDPGGSADWCMPQFSARCVDGGDGWWKSDADTCTMRSNTAVYEPDCAARVVEILAGLGACEEGAPTPIAGPYPSAADRQIKTLVLDLSVENDAFALQDARIIYNFPPKLFLRDAAYLFELIDENGETLFDMTIRDPRVMHVFADSSGPAEKLMVETQRFTIFVPFVKGMRTAVLTDRAQKEVVLKVDLTPAVEVFCAAHSDDSACAPN